MNMKLRILEIISSMDADEGGGLPFYTDAKNIFNSISDGALECAPEQQYSNLMTMFQTLQVVVQLAYQPLSGAKDFERSLVSSAKPLGEMYEVVKRNVSQHTEAQA